MTADKMEFPTFQPVGQYVGSSVATLLSMLSFALVLLLASPGVAKEPIKDIDKLLTEIYYIFEFVPRFEDKECVVGFEYKLEQNSWVDTRVAIWETFNRYLLIREPKAAVFHSIERDTPKRTRYFRFYDQCDRLDEIMEMMLLALRKEYPEIITRSAVEPIPDEVLLSLGVGDGTLIGQPLQYWALREAAVNDCTANAWVKVAQYHENEIGQISAEHRNYRQPLLYFELASRLAEREVGKIPIEQKIQAMAINVSTETKARIGTLIDAYQARGGCKKLR